MNKQEIGYGIAGFFLIANLLTMLIKNQKITIKEANQIIDASSSILEKVRNFPGDPNILRASEYPFAMVREMVNALSTQSSGQ